MDTTVPYCPLFRKSTKRHFLFYTYVFPRFLSFRPVFCLNRFLEVFYLISGNVDLLSEIYLFCGESKFPLNKENCLVNYEKRDNVLKEIFLYLKTLERVTIAIL